jgi:3',5'-cyclic AMP phosphodiesterase CpdA
MKKYIFFFLAISLFFNVNSQQIPKSYSNISWAGQNKMVMETDRDKFELVQMESRFTLHKMIGQKTADQNGIHFDFQIPDFEGTMYYGLINYEDGKHPFPVFFKKSAEIKEGRTYVNIRENLSGKYDMSGWAENNKGVLGYRLVDKDGKLLYEGRVAFAAYKEFEVLPTVIEGPFVNIVKNNSVVISFTTDQRIKAKVELNYDDEENILFFEDTKPELVHEIEIKDLKPETEYKYQVVAGRTNYAFTFKTAPEPGSRKPFVFAYASDSRNANGGGERNLYGANYYIMKKIMAVNSQADVAFMQFTGDLINGYSRNNEEINLQYANWKRSIEAFAHYFPVNVGMGNHEALLHVFLNNMTGAICSIDKFPFDKNSSEVVFASNFVNPENGPKSEDGAYYDPDERNTDFPPYNETVFYYTYDNVAMVVLNSDYWYAPSLKDLVYSSGNLHGYILDNQMAWLEATIKTLEKDKTIDHIFITQHTPAFPNGGHVDDDMWYNGNNRFRPYVAGEAVQKGIIERRDEYLNVIINKSDKVVAILTGDEHNYARTEISPEMPMYPDNYEPEKIKLKRTIYQINNGAAGAPYYAQEETPWSANVSGFTTQNAVVHFYIDGASVKLKVINPDTLEVLDEFVLR